MSVEGLEPATNGLKGLHKNKIPLYGEVLGEKYPTISVYTVHCVHNFHANCTQITPKQTRKDDLVARRIQQQRSRAKVVVHRTARTRD